MEVDSKYSAVLSRHLKLRREGYISSLELTSKVVYMRQKMYTSLLNSGS